jgi:DNA-binding IclR family transcriptional regulator
VFLLPLTGRDEDALATWSGRSGCFINGTEARSGVRYVLGVGSRLAFGSAAAGDYVVAFTESSGANPLVSMLMDGLAAGASPDVRDALKKL